MNSRYLPLAFSVVLASVSVTSVAAPPQYTANTNAVTGALVSTSYEHNTLSAGLTPYYGYYQTVFPSMNDLGVVSSRLPASAQVVPPFPISQASANLSVAAVWRNGVATQLTWPLGFRAWDLKTAFFTPTGTPVIEVRGCRDDEYDQIPNISTCASRANAINNSNTIVGTSHYWIQGASPYFEKSFKWTMSLDSTIRRYPEKTISSYAWSQSTNPTDITEQGTVVGTGITEGGAPPYDTYEHGLVQGTGFSTYIGVKYQRSRAHAVNESNRVTGAAFYDAYGLYNGSNKEWRAYLWENGVINWLGTLPGGTASEGFDINDSNVIVGAALNNAGQQVAFRWDNATGMQAIGTLGGQRSIARSINNAGIIVGTSTKSTGEYRAFIYTDGVMYQLDNYLAELPIGWVIEDAYTVNERNQILVRARNASLNKHAYWILNPPAVDQGNTLQTAQLINPNDAGYARIDTNGDVDFFKVVLPQDGTLVLSTTGTTDTFGSLYTENGVEIASNDNTDTLNFSITRYLLAGTYYISVRHAYSIGVGTYFAQSKFIPDDGDSVEEPSVLAASGSRASAIETASDNDTYVIYTPDLGNLVVYSVGSVDVKATLYNELGTVIASNDDYSSTNKNFGITYKVNPGIYYLKVESASGATGGYTVKSSFELIPKSADDYGSTMQSATPIALGATITGNIDNYNDEDFFTVTTTETANLVVYPGLSNIEPKVTIYNSNGVWLADNTSVWEGYNHAFVTNAPAGKYYISMKHWYGLGLGAYKLIVSLDREGNTVNSAKNITLGSSVAGSIDYYGYTRYAGGGNMVSSYLDSDIDNFNFIIASNALVTLSSVGSIDLKGRLFGPGVDYYFDDYNGSTDFKIVAYLAPGTYTLSVFPKNNEIGSYSINTNVSTAPLTDEAGGSTTTATSSTFGQVDGEIHYAGDTDVFSYDVAQSGYFLIRTTATSDVTFELLNSTGTLITAGGGTGKIGYNVGIGKVYVKVKSNTAYFGKYSFSTQMLVDESDPINVPANGNTTANIFPGDIDTFSIYVPTSGLLTIRTRSTEKVSIRGYVGNSVINADNDGNLVYAGPVRGGYTYSFTIYSNSYTAGGAGVYTFESTLGSLPNDDLINSLSSAKPMLLNNVTNDYFEYSYDQDIFKLSFPTPGYVTIKLSGFSSVSMILSDSKNSTICRKDGATFECGVGVAGDYFLYVISNSSLIGPYTIETKVSVLPPDDYTNDPSLAATVALGTSFTAKSDYAGDRDVVRISLATPKMLTIDVANTSNEGLVELYNNSGSSLTNVWGSGQRVLPVPGGDYFIRISSGTTVGVAATVTINGSDLPPDAGGTIATAFAIEANSSTSAAIDFAGDEDYYKITLASSSTLTAQTTSNMDTYGYLYDANGNLITYDDDAGTGFNFLISRALSAGTYYVRVRHYSASSTGQYTLLVSAN